MKGGGGGVDGKKRRFPNFRGGRSRVEGSASGGDGTDHSLENGAPFYPGA